MIVRVPEVGGVGEHRGGEAVRPERGVIAPVEGVGQLARAVDLEKHGVYPVVLQGLFEHRRPDRGATVVDEHTMGDFTWSVLTDPQGNVFCVAPH